MEDNFILIKDQLPEKGKDIIGLDESGQEHHCFRCACGVKACKEWRCSFTGFGLIIDIVKWKPLPEEKK